LALGTEVSLEALAEAGGVVADATARAVSAKVVAFAKKYITTRGALLKGAIRTTSTNITDATDVLERVPGLRVGLRSFVGELFLLDTTATAIAVGRAHSTLTCLAIVVIKAFALAGLPVAYAFHGALNA